MASIVDYKYNYMSITANFENDPFARKPVEYFYCSINNDVTIGTGHFMPTSSDAVALFKKNIKFFKRNGNTLVTKEEDIIEEWENIKKIGKGKRNWKFSTYKEYTNLYVEQNGLEKIFNDDFTQKIKLLIQKKPWAIALPIQIQFVLVDTLFNPAGVPLFGTKPKIIKMWECFNKFIMRQEIGALEDARNFYWQVFHDRGTIDYKNRVKERLRYFDIGISLLKPKESALLFEITRVA